MRPSPTETQEARAISVSAFATRIARAVRSVGGAVIEGEAQKPQRSRRGLLYFDLTDGEATLSCKVFGRQIPRLAHEPREGDLVRVRVERPDFWVGGGKLSLVVTNVELAGVGELLRRRAELLERLRGEGLCDPDRRKPLPSFPRAVGLIAGKDSDGMSDVIRAIRDRFPPAHVVACPALVQGRAAPRDLIDALARLQEHPRVDVIVLARGGGSVQDLVAFDDERLCRAVFACATPVIAAIGHTDNIPVCNHVTHAAPTPSRSAELAVPSLVELEAGFAAARRALDGLADAVGHRAELIAAVRGRIEAAARLDARRRDVGELGRSVASAETSFFAAQEKALSSSREMLATLPLRSRATLAARERGVGEQLLQLEPSARRRNEDARATVAEHRRWLGNGIGRQLEDHERDYGHAIRRLLADTSTAAGDRIGERRLEAAATGRACREAVDSRLARAGESAAQLTALIEARDFRRHGYVLATDLAGKPVNSVADAPAGASLELRFRDGHARVSVQKTKESRR